MFRIHSSSWRPCLLGAGTAIAVAVGSGRLLHTANASSPPGTTDAAPVRESPGYATAEDAVSAYMAGAQRADLDAMVSAFAIETYAANFDLTAYLELVGVYNPTAPVRLPSSNPFNSALNAETRAAQVVNTLQFQYLTLCCPDLDPVNGEALPDEPAVTRFVDELSTSADSSVLSSLGSFAFVPLDEIDPDSYEVYVSERNQETLARRTAVLGADELTDLAVRVPLADGDVYVLFGAVRYGDDWWLNELGGMFATLLDVRFSAGGIVPVAATD